jgi:hypothetical protein
MLNIELETTEDYTDFMAQFYTADEVTDERTEARLGALFAIYG